MAVSAAPDVASPAPAFLRRVRVRLTASLLDARLAAGKSPWSDADLACRSAQLVAKRTRRGLAEGLERLWSESCKRPGVSAAIGADPRAVRLARPVLEQLACALRGRPSVDPRGVALTRLMLTDACSALYLPAYPEELHEIVRVALVALGPGAAAERNEEGHHAPTPHATPRRAPAR